MITSSFDKIAEAYYSSTPAIPHQYIHLLQKTFQIKKEDRILDLGCGSGDLALTFAKKSAFVEGIDSSKSMIVMAKKNDRQNQVTWRHASVEDIDFEEEKYHLMMSFEAFHLFPHHKRLIQRCARALKPGGFFSLGWVMYEWDLPLKDAIAETFAAYGIFRGEWGLWTCPNFSDDVAASETRLSTPQKRVIRRRTKTPIPLIMDYIFSNSRSAFLRLSEDAKRAIVQELRKRFLTIYPSGESNGFTTYSLLYSEKK